MKAHVTFEFELEGNPSPSEYQANVSKVVDIMYDALIGNGFTNPECSLKDYKFRFKIVMNSKEELLTEIKNVAYDHLWKVTDTDTCDDLAEAIADQVIYLISQEKNSDL